MHSNAGMELVSLRLESGADIRRDLERLVKRDKISAAVVLGAVGSLSNVCLRFADQNKHTTLKGKHEILTLSGTLGEGGVHLHMSVADTEGECKGGHMVYGCRVNTTLELVIGLVSGVKFDRVMDEKTGSKELEISKDEEE
ncbi:MAG: PPC domain-containing DNA-binding protein [Phormidesmis sp.]